MFSVFIGHKSATPVCDATESSYYVHALRPANGKALLGQKTTDNILTLLSALCRPHS